MRVPAKSKSAAHKRYVRFLQLSLSCVSRSAHLVTGPRPTGEDGELALTTKPERIRLTRPDAEPVFLTAIQNFHFVPDQRYEGEWKVQTDAYIYHVFMGDEDADQLFAWHCHPEVRPGCHLHVGPRVGRSRAWHCHPEVRPGCHLHVGPRVGRSRALYRLHVPTGRVAFEEVLRFLIDEFNVRRARQDWDSILSDSQTRFEAFRTWPGFRREGPKRAPR